MRLIGTWLLATLLWLNGTAAVAADSEQATLTVFAAASLTDVLQSIGPEYTRANRITVKYSFAASSALARQIDA